MQTNEPSVSVTDLIKQQERNQQKEAELKMKRAKIKAFKGLPPVSVIQFPCEGVRTQANEESRTSAARVAECSERADEADTAPGKNSG